MIICCVIILKPKRTSYCYLDILLTEAKRAQGDEYKGQETANPNSEKTERDEEQEKLMTQDIMPVSDMKETRKQPPKNIL